MRQGADVGPLAAGDPEVHAALVCGVPMQLKGCDSHTARLALHLHPLASTLIQALACTAEVAYMLLASALFCYSHTRN